MALKLSGESDTTIQKYGRWSSTTFLDLCLFYILCCVCVVSVCVCVRVFFSVCVCLSFTVSGTYSIVFFLAGVHRGLMYYQICTLGIMIVVVVSSRQKHIIASFLIPSFKKCTFELVREVKVREVKQKVLHLDLSTIIFFLPIP